jgi:hypothetical protein
VGGNGGSARRGVMPCAGPSTANPSHARSAPAWPALHARTWCRGRVRFRPGGSKGAMCVRQLMIIDRGARPEARSRESPGPVPRGAQWSRPACWPARASPRPALRGFRVVQLSRSDQACPCPVRPTPPGRGLRPDQWRLHERRLPESRCPNPASERYPSSGYLDPLAEPQRLDAAAARRVARAPAMDARCTR